MTARIHRRQSGDQLGREEIHIPLTNKFPYIQGLLAGGGAVGAVLPVLLAFDIFSLSGIAAGLLWKGRTGALLFALGVLAAAGCFLLFLGELRSAKAARRRSAWKLYAVNVAIWFVAIVILLRTLYPRSY